jgi:hypothetical protein
MAGIRWRQILACGVGGLILGLFAACSSPPKIEPTPKWAALEERAREFYALVGEMRFSEALDYVSREYKKRVPFSRFQGRNGAANSAKVLAGDLIEVYFLEDGKTGYSLADIYILVSLPMMQVPAMIQLSEEWIQEDGKWVVKFNPEHFRTTVSGTAVDFTR